MTVKYTIPDEMDARITDMWRDHGAGYSSWGGYVKTLGTGILDVTVDMPMFTARTTITFETEEHMNWFLLKYG